MNFRGNTTRILNEIHQVLERVDEAQVEKLAGAILSAKTIVTIGAGRVGMQAKAFSMRLGHLGLSSYFLGDSTLPSLGPRDLLLVASGSGETQTIFDLVTTAKQHNVKIALVTGNRNSRIAWLSDVIVEIHAPSKTKAVEGLESVQPMTTLNEQCLGIFFDSLVLDLMHTLHETHDTMWARHSFLE